MVVDIHSSINGTTYSSSSGLFHRYSLGETFPVSLTNLTAMTGSLSTAVTKDSHQRLWNRFMQKLPEGTDKRALSQNTMMRPTISILVRLRGEMANHMSCIAHARGIQLFALETFGIESNLVFVPQYDKQQRRQGADKVVDTSAATNSTILINPKGRPARKILNQCFPSIQRWNIVNYANSKTQKASLIRPEAVLRRKQEQADLLRGWTVKDVQGTGAIVTKTGNDTAASHSETDPAAVPLEQVLDWINGRRPPRKGLRKPPFSDNLRLPVQETDIEQSLHAVQQLASKWALQLRNGTGYNRKLEYTSDTVNGESLINLPFLDSNSLDIFWLVDRYYDDFRALFSFWSHGSRRAFGFGESSCCTKVPYPDESVFVSLAVRIGQLVLRHVCNG